MVIILSEFEESVFESHDVIFLVHFIVQGQHEEAAIGKFASGAQIGGLLLLQVDVLVAVLQQRDGHFRRAFRSRFSDAIRDLLTFLLEIGVVEVESGEHDDDGGNAVKVLRDPVALQDSLRDEPFVGIPLRRLRN